MTSSGKPNQGDLTGGAARWAAVAALALPALLYLATLYPGIGDRAASGDAVEFQTVGRALGVAHEPGYPQYVVLSFFWSWVPLPLTLATKINLLSAVFAVAAGGFFLATARAMTGAVTATILACWALLTAPDLWRLATEAEVYTLHVLWVTVFFWAALRWRRGGERGALMTLLFAYALAFGNHLTMIALLPALAILLLARQPQLAADLSAWRWAAIAAASGAAQYLLLVWRSYFPHPTLLERFPLRASPGEILAYVTGGRFVEKHWLPVGGGEWLERAAQALEHGVEQLTPPFALLALYGVVSGWRRDPSRTVFLSAAAVSVVLFAAAYDIRDWLLYCIPAWVVAGLLAADGTARVMRRMPRAGLILAFALGVALAPRIVGGVAKLRVSGNPSDLTRVLPALPAGSRVVPAGGQRLSRLHEDYYRYAERVKGVGELRFLAARQDILHKGLHLRRRAFFFRSPTVAKIFGNRLIDYRVWPGWEGADGPMLVTGTNEPLTEIGLRALPGPALELGVRDARRMLSAEKDLFLFFVAASDGRAKGLEALDLSEKGASERLRLLLDQLPAGDLIVLLVPRLRAEARGLIEQTLAAADVGPLGPSDHRLVAVWRHRGGAGSSRLWRDPPDGTAWTLALAELR